MSTAGLAPLMVREALTPGPVAPAKDLESFSPMGITDSNELGTHLHQEFERAYWGDCCNSFDEESKQYEYAYWMGLTRERDSFPLNGKSVLDIGGGPCSLLLKCTQLGPQCRVVDPCRYPRWTYDRYASHGIASQIGRGEDLALDLQYDEVWLYNVLQHTDDPEEILRRAWASIRPLGRFRFFEWIDIPPHEGHPHMITPTLFSSLGMSANSTCRIGQLHGPRCVGKYYAGSIVRI